MKFHKEWIQTVYPVVRKLEERRIELCAYLGERGYQAFFRVKNVEGKEIETLSPFCETP